MYRTDILRNVGPKTSLIRFSTLTPFRIGEKESCTEIKQKRKRKRKSRKPIFKQDSITLFFD